MSVEFKVFQRAERVSLGSVASLAGVGGKLKLIPANLNNPDKSVALVIEKANGTSALVIMSRPLSKLFRSKEVNLSKIAKMEVVEQLLTQGTNKGAIINIVVLPTSSTNNGLVEVAVDQLKDETYNPTLQEVDYSALLKELV